MKLIDCTISSFGALSDYHIEFLDGVTTLFEQNGFGKTTLAAFIKAMFYGFPTARKNQSADSSERAKYYPFGGGNFGGRLTFEVGGRQYRIIRSFDRYSITGDSFELIDAKTGAVSNDFSENIGAELFGVDENGFVKSTFSNGNADFSALPVSIRNKISSAVNTADDLDDFESAKSRLANAIKAIEGKKGSLDMSERCIQGAKTDIERLKTEMAEFERISAVIKNLESQKQALEHDKKDISDKISRVQGAEASRIKAENYAKLLAKFQSIKESIAVIEQKYLGSVPQNDTVDLLCEKTAEYKKQLILKSAEQKKDENPELRAISQLFENDFPSDEEMGTISSQIRLINKVGGDISRLKEQKQSLNAQFVSLGILNAENIPDEGKLNEIRAISSAPSVSAPSKGITVLTVLSALLLFAGVGLCFVYTVVGIAVAAVGAVALIACLLLGSVKKMVSGTVSVSVADKKRAEQFLIEFGFSKDADINSAVDKLKSALSIKEQIKNCDVQIAEADKKLSAALETCWAFMDSFLPDRENGVENAFNSLRRSRDRYLNEILPARDSAGNIEVTLKNLQNELAVLFAKIGVLDIEPSAFESKIDEIQGDIQEHSRLFSELEEAQSEAEKLRDNNGEQLLDAQKDLPAIEVLSQSLEEIEVKLSEILSEIPSLRLQADRLSQSRGQINELEEVIETQTEAQMLDSAKLKNLKSALEFLNSAKDTLSEKYSEGLNASFSKYSQMFFDKDLRDAKISSELSLSVEREGKGRIPEFFSNGQKSVMDVCLRLSLIEAMFEKEKPFLILDDPFVSLDENNLKSARSLLKEASSEFQIIYLTCHESRSI